MIVLLRVDNMPIHALEDDREMKRSVAIGLLALALLCNALSVHAITIGFPTSDAWYTHWKTLCKKTYLTPKLADARVVLPATEERIGEKLMGYTVDLVNGDKVVGDISVSADWSTLLSFHGPVAPYKEGTQAVNLVRMQKIAEYFAMLFANPVPGRQSTEAPRTISDCGTYTFDIDRSYERVSIQNVEVVVDYTGHIIEARLYDLSSNLQRDITKEIPPAPTETIITSAMHAFLAKKGMKDINIPVISRIILFDKVGAKLTPRFEWQTTITQLATPTPFSATLKCDEKSRACSLSKWNDAFDENAPVQHCATAVTWDAKGKCLWWCGNVRWEGVPDWITDPPTSLCRQSLAVDGAATFIYRPFPDIDMLTIAYQYPSISPDGHWLAVAVNGDTLAFIDLLHNRAQYTPGETKLSSRVSWNTSGNAIVYCAMGEAYLQIADTQGDTPFDMPKKPLKLGQECEAIAFLPEHQGTLVALCRDGTTDHGSMLVRFEIPKDSGIKTRNQKALNDGNKVQHFAIQNKEVIIDDNGEKRLLIKASADEEIIQSSLIIGNLDSATEMQVLPDGKHVLVMTSNGMVKVDVDSGAREPIAWIKYGATVGQGLSITFSSFGWDVSPDGKQIAFTAEQANGTHDSVVCLANIDGTQLRCISPKDNDISPFYPLVGQNKHLPKDQLPIGLAKRLQYQQ